MSDVYDAVIYDLDGTLVDLAVDWDAVADAVASRYEAAGHDPPGGLWTMLEESVANGIERDVREVISDHECRGARQSHRLPLADEVTDRSVPVAVCSLNCERACHIALAEHGLERSVDVVVGRDTVEPWKPAPDPLLTIADRLTVEPGSMVFVGDSKRDELAAQAAGVDFEWV